MFTNPVGLLCAKCASDQRARGGKVAVTNQMVNGLVVTLRAVAHDSTALGTAVYISEKNHRVVNRPAEGQPECDIFTLVALQ